MASPSGTRVTALDDLSVEVPRGRIGLVGANGAGKTAAFRLLPGLARAPKGRVEVCGVDVARDPIGVRSRLGYMPEHDCLPLVDGRGRDVDVLVVFEVPGVGRRLAWSRPDRGYVARCPQPPTLVAARRSAPFVQLRWWIVTGARWQGRSSDPLVAGSSPTGGTM